MATQSYKCLKCGMEWNSNKPGHPVQCKRCKRKDWDGLHNSTGRLLSAPVVRVAAAAVPSVTVGVPCTCAWCGGSWVSRSAETVPVQCPKCKRVKWGGVDPFDPEGLLEPGRCKCDKCGNDWISKVAGLPKACPSCRATNWSKAAVDAWVHERKNPELADCAIKWFYASTGPRGAKELQGDPVTGTHQWHVNITGLCNICGWNNLTGVQVGNNNPTPITEAERERRITQWEMENPGEKW